MRDTIHVGFVNSRYFTKSAQTLGIFGLRQMAATGARAHNFSASRNFESLGHGFPGFDAFGTSHKIISIAKERGIYLAARFEASAKFFKMELNYGLPKLFNAGGVAVVEAGLVMSIGAPAFNCLITSSVKSLSSAE